MFENEYRWRYYYACGMARQELRQTFRRSLRVPSTLQAPAHSNWAAWVLVERTEENAEPLYFSIRYLTLDLNRWNNRIEPC
jgi:hypothetical protein